MTIWKYPLTLTRTQTVEMPEQSTLISVALKDGGICMWAIVADENLPKRARAIHIFGTGREIGYTVFPGNFLGTVQQGDFVWHVFDAGWVSA